MSAEGIACFESEESDYPQAFFPLHTIKDISPIELKKSSKLLKNIISEQLRDSERVLFQNLFEIEIDTVALEDYLHQQNYV